MNDEIMARIGSHGYLSAGSQSLVLDGHEAYNHLVLGVGSVDIRTQELDCT
jgi:hypothetical protein